MGAACARRCLLCCQHYDMRGRGYGRHTFSGVSAIHAQGMKKTPPAVPTRDGEAPWRGSTLLLRSSRPVSRPTRRALPLPLPDALSPRRPEGRFQRCAAPLCLLDAGTLSVHRGRVIILPATGRRVKEENGGGAIYESLAPFSAHSRTARCAASRIKRRFTRPRAAASGPGGSLS